MTREQYRQLKRGDTVIAAGMLMTVRDTDVQVERCPWTCLVVVAGDGSVFYYSEQVADILSLEASNA